MPILIGAAVCRSDGNLKPVSFSIEDSLLARTCPGRRPGSFRTIQALASSRLLSGLRPATIFQYARGSRNVR
jgi:hypothetical protein